MNREFAVRLVIFEYLLPMQRHGRLQTFNTAIKQSRDQHVGRYTQESSIHGMMEILLLLSDRLLETRGYPTSFLYPHKIRFNWYSWNNKYVNSLMLADRPTKLDEPFCDENFSNPFYGHRIFTNQAL
jgi:hypothetical protein